MTIENQDPQDPEEEPTDDIFARDCGMDGRSWDLRIENDFGPDAVTSFREQSKLIERALRRASQTSEPDINTELTLHQLFPFEFPDPMTGETLKDPDEAENETP